MSFVQQKDFSIVSTVLIVTAYITLNSSLNLLNRFALGVYGFRFPFLLTASHMGFCFLALLPYLLSNKHAAYQTLQHHWRGLLAIGAFLAIGISLNNISLVYISLSLNQVLKSSIPVVTCLLSIIVEKKFPTRLEALSLVLLTLGVMIAVWEGTVSGSPLGITFCLLGTVSSGAMMTFSGKLLSEKLDVLSLTFYTAPVSLICLSFPLTAFELKQFGRYFLLNHQAVVMLVLISCVNALAYNICHYLVIQRISAVATTVIGEVKIIGLMILSAMLLGEKSQFTFKMSLGCLLALGGFCLYSHLKIMHYRKQQEEAFQLVDQSSEQKQ